MAPEAAGHRWPARCRAVPPAACLAEHMQPPTARLACLRWWRFSHSHPLGVSNSLVNGARSACMHRLQSITLDGIRAQARA